MAIEENTVWLARDEKKGYETQYNLVLLANASDVGIGEYNDSAQITGRIADTQNLDAQTIKITGGTANLEIGGNYEDGEGNVCYSADTKSSRSVSAILFTQNGILHLTAENGARTFQAGAKVFNEDISDDRISLRMEKGSVLSGLSSDELYIATLRANETLAVSSDLCGEVFLNNAFLRGAERSDESVAGIYAIHAKNLYLTGNYTADVRVSPDSGDSSVLLIVSINSLLSTHLHYSGINVAETLVTQEKWGGSIAVAGGTIHLRAVPSSSGSSDRYEISQNDITTAAIDVSRESGTLLSVASIGGSGTVRDFTSEMEVNGGSVMLYAMAGKEQSVAAIEGNTVSTTVLNANTISLGEAADNTSFTAAGGTVMFYSGLAGGTITDAQSLNNNVLATGFSTDKLEMGAFEGTISVTGGQTNFVFFNGSKPTTVSDDLHPDVECMIKDVGILANDITSKSFFGGTISVAGGDNAAEEIQVSDWTIKYEPGENSNVQIASGSATAVGGTFTKLIKSDGITCSAWDVAGAKSDGKTNLVIQSGTITGGTATLENGYWIIQGLPDTEEKTLETLCLEGATVTAAEISGKSIVVGGGTAVGNYITTNGSVVSATDTTRYDTPIKGGASATWNNASCSIDGKSFIIQESSLTGSFTLTTNYQELEDSILIQGNVVQQGDVYIVTSGTVLSTDFSLKNAILKKWSDNVSVSAGTVAQALQGDIEQKEIIGKEVIIGGGTRYFALGNVYEYTYGIETKRLADPGRLGVTVYGSVDAIDACITAGTICTDAFSGVLKNAATGIVSGTFFSSATELAGTSITDAVDISGTITDVTTALDLSAIITGANIRVSGYIDAVTAIATSDEMHDDVVEVAAGGTICGNLEFGKSPTADRLILNSNGTLDAKTLAAGGLLEMIFVLDGEAKESAVLSTDSEDVSMASVSTVNINLDLAEVGESYQLIHFDEVSANQWKERKVTFILRNEEQIAYLNGGTSATVTFSGGGTATVSFINGTLTATLGSKGSISAYPQLNTTDVVSSFSDQDLVLDWSACDWTADMANCDFYEIKYSVNDEKDVILRLTKAQTSATITDILPGDTVKWSIRGISINAHNAGYYTDQTEWSEEISIQRDLDYALPSMEGCYASASGQYTRDAAKIYSAAALVYWTPAKTSENGKTDTTIDYYQVEYFESLSKLSEEDAKAELESRAQAGTLTSVKQTSDTSVMLSSLTTRCFIYWRVKAVDINGRSSDFIQGEEFRVFDGDETPPVFHDEDVKVSYEKNGSNVNINVTWSYATDDGSGMKYYLVALTDSSGVLQQTQTFTDDGSQTYSASFNGVAKSNYTVSVTAFDYDKNNTTISSAKAVAPTLDADAFKVNYTKITNTNYVSLKVSWDKASSASGIAMDKYIVTLSQNDVVKQQITVDVTDNDVDSYNYVFNNVVAGEYTVSLQAFDLAQNASETLSQFRICGAIDLNGEWGTITKQPTISASYTETAVTTSAGYSYYDSKTGTIVSGGTTFYKEINSASAVFTWSDTFNNDRGIYYALDFSDTNDFSGTVYTYYTESSDVVYTAGTRTATLNQDASSPISILEAVSGGTVNKKIYWRVRAGGRDDDGFVSTATSGVNSFYFTYDDGTPIAHGENPARASVSVSQTQQSVSDIAAKVYDGKLTVSISTEKTDLGIAKYVVTFKNKSNSAYSYTWTADYNDDLIEVTTGTTNSFTKVFDFSTIFGDVNYDGTYEVTVTTYNAVGNSTSTNLVVIDGATVSSFAVDTIAPTKVTNVTLQTFAASVLVKWNASYDASGIKNYIVKGRVAGLSTWQDMITVDASATSAFVSGLSDNKYQFAVCAVDKNGNVSEFSEQPSINVYVETDYEDNYIPDKWVTFSETNFSVGNSIGSSDKADYFCVACDVSCTMSINLAMLECVSGSANGITIAFYKYAGTNQERAIKSFSVTSAKQLLTDYALEAGEYFVKVTSNNAASVYEYSLAFNKSNFSTAALNNTGDNNWASIDESVFAPISTANQLIDWVGYGDDIDYRRVSFSVSGNYSLTMKTSGDPATLTLYEVSGTTLTAVKSISTEASDFATMVVLLDDQKTYYIGTTAAGNATLKNSDYTVSLTLNHGYSGTTVSHQDDTAALAAANYTALSMENNRVDDWVGLGDSIDYRKLSLTYGGKYNLRLSGIEHTVNFTLYQQDAAGQLKALRTLVIDPAEGRTATGQIGNILLDSGANATYFVSVEAVDAAQEKNSKYSLLLTTYSVFSDGAQNKDDTAAKAVKNNYHKLVINGSIGDSQDTDGPGWVGFGDEVDYRRVILAESEQGTAYSGKYTFTISGVSNLVSLSIWRKADSEGSLSLVNSMTVASGSGTLTQLLDKDEEYYISVNCINCDDDHNSNYVVKMDAIQQYPEAQKGDDWSDLATLGAASSAYGSFGTLKASTEDQLLVRQDNVTGERGTSKNWVSFGDTVDYVKFTINSAAKLTFTIQGWGDVRAQMTINSLNQSASGYSLTSLGGVEVCSSTGSTGDLWLEKGTYYIAVEALNANEGGNGNYEITLGKESVFYPNSNYGNTDATWQDAWAHQQDDPWLVKRAATSRTDWIGFGNAADYWRVQLAEEGKLQIELEGAAYDNGNIKLDLVDAEGNKLEYVQEGNIFTTTTWITGGNVCYFGVIGVWKENEDPSSDYKAKLSLIALK